MAKRNLDETLELLNLDDTMEMINLEEEGGFGYYLDDTEEEDDYIEGEERTGTGYTVQEAETDEPERTGIVCRRKRMDTIDRVVAAAGSLILVLAIVLGSVYVNAQAALAQVASFEEVGTQMDGISVIGESGLLAMSDAQSAKALEEAAADSGMPETEYEEKELYAKGSVEVEMHLSSMQKDLKIKFVSKKTGKLILSVPFEVDVTTADGKSYMLIDEDMDGIIYQTEVAPGKCSVAMKKLDGAEEYAISEEKITVVIKDKIEYKKVDVADEVKTEAQVNAAVEDTKRQASTESEAKDTVGWVESSKNPAAGVKQPEAEGQTTADENGEYEEVPKENITDPSAAASISGVYKMPVRLAAADATSAGENITEPSAQEQIKYVQTTEEEQTQTEQTEPEQTQVNVTLSQSALTMKKGESCTLQAVTSPEGSEVTWTSDADAVASVQDGVITAVSAGTANISAVTAAGSTAVCVVTVTEQPTAEPAAPAAGTASITISQTGVSVAAGKTIQIGAAVTGAEDKGVIWSSDNEAVATVAQDGTITGVTVGTAVITAAANTDSNVKATCQVTVRDVPEKDTVTRLRDNSGNQLYVKDGEGNFREAVYADYYMADKFYKKTQVTDDGTADTDTGTGGEYTYTGWQTIDGKTYYFDADGNKVTGEQVIQGIRYTFDSEGVLCTSSGNMGIDVSKWNGSIDWNAVKNSGVSYVIIRCGYRGSTTGALIEDPSFRTNIQGASSAGLKVGIYFFTQAVNEVEAVEEASMVAGLISGYHISYPVFLDVEPSGGRADGISRELRTAVCSAFCQTIQNSGYTAGIYANSTWLKEKINTSSLSNYKIWLAQYAASPTYTATRYDLWQYSSKGKISGISTDTDLNVSYLGY